MPAKARRALIEEQVLSRGEIDFASLATAFGVSEMTIRRDVEALENKGVVRRVIGGAIALVGKSSEPAFEARAAVSAAEKSLLAERVVELLEPHETVILDSGSTVLAVAKAIRGRQLGLTIVTPSILVAIELANEPDTTILLAGGQVRPGELSLVGAETVRTFSLYNCDTYVMGIAGVDARRGVSEYHHEEGNVKKAAVRSADRVIVAADRTKLGRVQMVNIAPLDIINVLVTDGSPTDPTIVAAHQAGVQVVYAKADDRSDDEATGITE